MNNPRELYTDYYYYDLTLRTRVGKQNALEAGEGYLEREIRSIMHMRSIVYLRATIICGYKS